MLSVDSAAIIGTAGVVVGALIGSTTTQLGQRSATRKAARAQAASLLAQVRNAVGAFRMEIVTFKLRRDSRRANGLAVGYAFFEVLAGKAEGNWVRGAATSIRELRAWDMGEADRFQARFQLATAEINPALLLLSMIESPIRLAAAELSEALRAYTSARKQRDIDAETSASRMRRTSWRRPCARTWLADGGVGGPLAVTRGGGPLPGASVRT
jgi:hypothetical protein